MDIFYNTDALENDDDETYEPSIHSDDEPDDCVNDLSDDEVTEPSLPSVPPSLRRQRTAELRSKIPTSSLLPIVLATLELWAASGIDLPIFLNALSWGDLACRQNKKVQYARTTLMHSEELPGIIRCWHRPPRLDRKGKRPEAAREVLDAFVLERVKERVSDNMKRSSSSFVSPPDEVNEHALTHTNYDDLILETKASAPFVWEVFLSAAYTEKQRKRNTSKNPDLIVLNMISQAQYSRSQRRGRLPKLHAIYLKACGMSARAFDFVHILGITMSHKWTANAYKVLSALKLKEAQAVVRTRPWVISHDNVNFPLRVFSQRLQNQSHFISATAATVWVLPASAFTLSPNANRNLVEYRAEKSKELFNQDALFGGDILASKRIEAQHVHHVLRILLDCPEFSGYAYRKDPILQPPPPVDPLPTGPAAAIQPLMLPTVDIEEASYEGTMKVMMAFLKYLGFESDEDHQQMSIGKLICWLGDQLTVDRLRGMFRLRAEDFNSMDRLDFMIPVAGWFHALMALANSLHTQYLGTSAGVGWLRQGIDLLQRKGLINQSTKGPFWHHLDELLHHVSEAHFRACWKIAGQVNSLTELQSRSPSELLSIAHDIIEQYASRRALERIDNMPEVERDQMLRQSIQWNSDILIYIELRSAIRAGDVGRIEDLLPTLLFRFSGGGNSKYAIEMLELLQGLRQEWTPEVRQYVKHCCWLMTTTGDENSFHPYDLGQEHKIADVKVHFHALGPGANMEHLTQVSPAIPTLRMVKDHITSQFSMLEGRGKHHHIPNKEQDISKLTASYDESHLYVETPGRTHKSTQDLAEDYITKGYSTLSESSTIPDWFKRRTRVRSTEEDWSPVQ